MLTSATWARAPVVKILVRAALQAAEVAAARSM